MLTPSAPAERSAGALVVLRLGGALGEDFGDAQEVGLEPAEGSAALLPAVGEGFSDLGGAEVGGGAEAGGVGVRSGMGASSGYGRRARRSAVAA